MENEREVLALQHQVKAADEQGQAPRYRPGDALNPIVFIALKVEAATCGRAERGPADLIGGGQMTLLGAQQKHAISPMDFRLLPQNCHSCDRLRRQGLPRSGH